MTDQHTYSFFGQNTGLIINSSSKSEPYLYLRTIKRKPDGKWEKPSKGEGKVIKCSLEEMIMILQVLHRNSLNWASFHSFKDNKTPISFSWEDTSANTLWIKIANYSKMLNFSQVEILKRILEHVLDEKIQFATSSNFNDQFDKKKAVRRFKDEKLNSNKNSIDIINNPKDSSKLEKDISNKQEKNLNTNEMSNVNGIIQGETEKALLINFNSDQEIWIPKSTIHKEYLLKKNLEQDFLIDNWILRRNKIIS